MPLPYHHHHYLKYHLHHYYLHHRKHHHHHLQHDLHYHHLLRLHYHHQPHYTHKKLISFALQDRRKESNRFLTLCREPEAEDQARALDWRVGWKGKLEDDSWKIGSLIAFKCVLVTQSCLTLWPHGQIKLAILPFCLLSLHTFIFLWCYHNMRPAITRVVPCDMTC